MIDYIMLGAKIAWLFILVCVILSEPDIYKRIKHIGILRIMAKIGGADYNDKF